MRNFSISYERHWFMLNLDSFIHLKNLTWPCNFSLTSERVVRKHFRTGSYRNDEARWRDTCFSSAYVSILLDSSCYSKQFFFFIFRIIVFCVIRCCNHIIVSREQHCDFYEWEYLLKFMYRIILRFHITFRSSSLWLERCNLFSRDSIQRKHLHQ